MLACDRFRSERLIALVKRDFDVHTVDCVTEVFELIADKKKKTDAVLLDAGLDGGVKTSILEELSARPEYKPIPVLLFTEKTEEMQQDCFLEAGAADILCPPLTEISVKKRIMNAIRSQDSVIISEMEQMLSALPSNIYLKDGEGRYVFSTHTWHHLDDGDDPDWTIRGKKDPEIRKDAENALEAMRADERILQTGKGCSYVIEINVDQSREFYKIIKEPLLDESRKVVGIIGLINDVTEEEILKKRLEQIAEYDSLTGLHNRRCFDNYVHTLKRGDKGCIGLLSVDCNGLKEVNDTYGHLVGDEYIRMCSMILKISVGGAGKVFRVGGDEFIVVLENVSSGEVEIYRKRIREMERLYCIKDKAVSMAVGGVTQELKDSAEENERMLMEALTRADRDMYLDKARSKQMK